MYAQFRRLVLCLPVAFCPLAAGSAPVSNGSNRNAAAAGTPLITVERTQAVAPASMPAESAGSVNRALTRLYRIPRAQPRQFGQHPAAARESAGTAGVTPRRSGTAATPAGRGEAPRPAATSDQNRMGYQHADAIRNSASELPVGDDLHRPPGDGTIVPAVPGGPAIPREASLTAYGWGPYPDPYYSGNCFNRSRLPSSKRDWVDYRYFGGQPSRYGYGRYSGTYGIDDGGAGEYFRFGFMEGYDRGRFDQQADARTESVLAHSGNHMSRGLAAFRSGQYREAAKYFKLASDMNQGDPSAMIYTAHALFAIGRYQEGTVYLRKAFTLEPRIAMLTYDMRDDYGKKADFDEQLAALRSASHTAPSNLDRLALLGYVLNYSGKPDEAYRVLGQARRIESGDKLVRLLYESTNPPDEK
jgi:hypothetical protein